MNRVAHASGKAALNMLTQTMALELAQHGIRVNAIAPGHTPYEESSKFDSTIKDIFVFSYVTFVTSVTHRGEASHYKTLSQRWKAFCKENLELGYKE